MYWFIKTIHVRLNSSELEESLYNRQLDIHIRRLTVIKTRNVLYCLLVDSVHIDLIYIFSIYSYIHYHIPLIHYLKACN